MRVIEYKLHTIMYSDRVKVKKLGKSEYWKKKWLDDKSLVRCFDEIFTRCLYFDSPYGVVKLQHEACKNPDTTHQNV